MTDLSTAYHEASHAVAAFNFGLPVIYISIRPHEEDAGRNIFDTNSEAFQKLDDLSCAVIKVAGEVGERMSTGSTERRFNWVAEGGDAEDARHFISRMGGDEMDNRHWAVVRAYALLRVRWEAVEEIVSLFQRNKTVLGEEVSRICLAEAARRSARLAAAKPPPSPRPDRAPKPAKKPQRRPSHGDREVRPFTFQVVVKEK